MKKFMLTVMLVLGCLVATATLTSPVFAEEEKTQTYEEVYVESIPFQSTTVYDETMAQGQRDVTKGVKGQQTVTAVVTLDSTGAMISRVVTSVVVTKEPVNQIIRIGSLVPAAPTTPSVEEPTSQKPAEVQVNPNFSTKPSNPSTTHDNVVVETVVDTTANNKPVQVESKPAQQVKPQAKPTTPASKPSKPVTQAPEEVKNEKKAEEVVTAETELPKTSETDVENTSDNLASFITPEVETEEVKEEISELETPITTGGSLSENNSFFMVLGFVIFGIAVIAIRIKYNYDRRRTSAELRG